MPAINAAIAAAITAAGLATGAATADITWTTTTVEPAPGWTTAVVAPAQRAPRRPATRARRTQAARTWRAATTCRPLDDGTWRVRRGDTLWLVAGCTGLTVRQIAQTSGIDPTSVLRVGQALHVPGGAR